ncbi:uncharacterized protein LOC123450621 [Hordeum vulgare subsp. vulgare]|uniref:uncharacterized protein LOC123450621 n=1 Tax=Hordeum vulgare subsp. vulgare TaxID=112509 RepID=UPI001D1A3CC8|nr:uncharacterized protein LOC123450621 [Hordeum vulgare subsp. vulgare]
MGRPSPVRLPLSISSRCLPRRRHSQCSSPPPLPRSSAPPPLRSFFLWAPVVVLVSDLSAAGAVLPGAHPDRTSLPFDLFPLREACRPSGCSLRAEHHGHWYERMPPEPAAEGDEATSSSSSPAVAARRPEAPYPGAYSRRLCSLPRP